MGKTQVLVRITPSGEMFCKTPPWGNEDFGTSNGGDHTYIIDVADLWSQVGKLATEIERLRAVCQAELDFYEWHMNAVPSQVLDELVARRAALHTQIRAVLDTTAAPKEIEKASEL